MLSKLRKDLKRYLEGGEGNVKNAIYLLFSLELWAVVIYRFGHWVYHDFRIPLLRALLRVAAFIAHKVIEVTAGIRVPFSTEVGDGFYIGHFGGIIISPKAIIGKNCSLGTGVVIGTRALGDEGVPVIGDNVYIGAGAKILGGIKIGNNVRIGANAVVIGNVPDNATVVGVPARIVKVRQ